MREALDRRFFADEASVVRELLASIALDDSARRRIEREAAALVRAIRAQGSPNLMESLLAEYGLSDDEGLALMCLAEAYLRVPDRTTIDALIRDKVGSGDWLRHAGAARSLLVNASTWGLVLSAGIVGGRAGAADGAAPVTVVRSLIERVGEPVVRRAVAYAMRAMGQQFVVGRTIEDAWQRTRDERARGLVYSFDMLGEAARTAADAEAYFDAYAGAIAHLGLHARAADVFDNPGISVKLSALHPRYEFGQRGRVLAELVPRLLELARSARAHGIGFNVDAEEANRLALSLDVIEAVLRDDALAGWEGFGIVVQAYAKQSLPVLNWFHGLATELDRRFAVRLVKGAYWDAEIKHAQQAGLDTYPVFTRKAATDVSYLACAQQLFALNDRLYAQFATHNAHTLAAVLALAPADARYEFQRLHGMGEALHDLAQRRHGRRCRIYAPVGEHKDLLAYLVRRMLENGANSSFVNQLLDPRVAPERLVRDPLDTVQALEQIPNPRIPPPPWLYGTTRRNARGWDLGNPLHARELEALIAPFADRQWRAAPLIAADPVVAEPALARIIRNPARPEEIVGEVHDAARAHAQAAMTAAAGGFARWRDTALAERAAILDRCADAYEAHVGELVALLVREAGKTRVDALADLREAVDFCRYYAQQARDFLPSTQRRARGPFVCISPWNFPLAIFTGQIAAALVCGNTVVAKPAEQTPLVAMRAVSLMHGAGVPLDALALVPGDGPTVGDALVADPRCAGVCFTGSTATAERIERAMAERGNPLAPLIAETGGLNAMIVDSTALPEAAVRDVVRSAFQSAGQRCSALRVLFVQADIEHGLLRMLEGAIAQTRLGDPWDPSTDIGPVIDDEAAAALRAHIDALDAQGRRLVRHPQDGNLPHGRFVAPQVFRLDAISQLREEVFGPVLHVVSFDAQRIDDVVAAINATGYGLTFGLHSRIDQRVKTVCDRIRVGNVYVNRNQIGAVVGVQPFSGQGLSGTGPKAGGPFTLERFVAPPPEHEPAAADRLPDAAAPVGREPGPARVDALRMRLSTLRAAAQAFALDPGRFEALQRLFTAAGPDFHALAGPLLARVRSRVEIPIPLAGPTGELNVLRLRGRGLALCLGPTAATLAVQFVRALSAGNAVVLAGEGASALAARLAPLAGAAGIPVELIDSVEAGDARWIVGADTPLDLVMFDAAPRDRAMLRRDLAARSGPRVALVTGRDEDHRLAHEQVISVDTTASGGNASLLTLEAD